MPLLDTSNKTMSLIIKILLLVLMIGGVSWIILSCGVNLWWNDKSPDIPSAKYSILIENTGRYIFTDDLTTDDGVYELHGYYELSEGKYRWHDTTLKLDPKYFGDIEVNKR